MDALKSHRIAVIDFGSNTVRLVVMSAIPGYSYRLEDEIREVVRLREGMTEEGLSDDAMARAFSTLRLFKRFCDSTRVDTVLATATSAVREAANGREFVERVGREIGVELNILEGEREAYYGVLGVLNEMPLDEGAMLDIGGGSAQVSQVEGRRFKRGQALTLGGLALTECFIKNREKAIAASEFKAVRAEIERQLDTVPWLDEIQKTTLVGLGGTIRNLATVECKRQKYPLDTLHGFVLKRTSVEESVEQLRQLPLSKREKVPGIRPDRADVILPGALVVLTLMERLEIGEIHISSSGLREGVFFEQFWQHLDDPIIADVRRFSVLNIARNYNYQKPHANHVRYLAGRTFEQLAPLHGYGLPERELLDAAALLHDLGTVISYNDHHKHSQTLIENNGLPGYAAREVGLIALLTRYHRKGQPDSSDYKMLLRGGDEKLLTCLAAILRLAEFMERGRNAAVDDVSVTWTDEQLRLTLIADEYPAVELWETERHAVPLMEEAFKRRVVLDTISPPGELSEQKEEDDGE